MRAYDKSIDGRPWWTKEMNGKTSLADHFAEAWKANPTAIALEARADGLYAYATREPFGPTRELTAEEAEAHPGAKQTWSETWKPHLEFALSL